MALLILITLAEASINFIRQSRACDWLVCARNASHLYLEIICFASNFQANSHELWTIYGSKCCWFFVWCKMHGELEFYVKFLRLSKWKFMVCMMFGKKDAIFGERQQMVLMSWNKQNCGFGTHNLCYIYCKDVFCILILVK